MKKNLLLTLATIFIAGSSISQNFWCVQNDQAHLLTINISNGTIVDSIGVSAANIAANPIGGFQGMAQHPTTGGVYVLFKDDNSDKFLGTMDMSTGVITTIAATTSNLATIAFDANGVLYAMQGDGSTQMYTLDIATAAETAFHSYASASSDGEALVFNTTDNLMYRYGGADDGDWVSLDLTTLAEDSITTMSGMDQYGGALAYRQGQNKFVLGLGETFYDVLPDGTNSVLSDITASQISSYFKGIVKVNFTGLNDLSGNSISIFPNPTNNIVNVNLGDGIGSTHYSLFTIDGRLIETNNTSNNSMFAVDLTNKANGVYFLKINYNSSIETYKIIKK
jgi:hypothetical protein